MRIMLDTNVLISALLFPASRINAMLEHIISRHTLVLSSFVVDELREVTRRKFPARVAAVETLLAQMSYEFVYTPAQMDQDAFHIRDAKDYPVLYTAMINGVDMLITGDKDFSGVDVDSPEVLTPAQFLERFV